MKYCFLKTNILFLQIDTPASKVINNYRPGFSTYKYIGLYDKDEYIVPELKTPLQGSLKSFVVSNKYYCTYS
jgi:hypothetical protein